MKRAIIHVFWCLIAIFAIAYPALASDVDFLTPEENQWLKDKKVLRIGNQMNWPPFDFNEDGVPKGYAIDHIKAIAETLGVEITFVNGYDWTNLVDQFRQGNFDVMPVFFMNDDRKKFTLYTRPFYKGKLGVFTRDDNIGIELKGIRVGMEKAHGSIPLVKRLLPDCELIEIETKKELVQQLATKKIDAIVANPFVIHHVAKKNEITNLVVSNFLNMSKEEEEASAFHIGVHKSLPILASIMDKAVANMDDAQRTEIENRWANISIVKGTDWVLIGQILVGVVAVILLLLWNIKIHRSMVREKTKELSKLNEELEQKVLERTRNLEQKNEQLEAAQHKAEVANQAKSQFLANMSHELRTPLNAVTGFSELLSSIVTDDKQKSYLEAIKTAGASLLTLINDILDLSKIEAGKFEMQRSAVDVRSVFREIDQLFSLRIKEQGLDFFVAVADDIPEALHLDEVRVRQILMNLLGNAVKFTEAGHIRVSAAVDNRQEDLLDLILTVEDTGVGIAEEDQELIFDVFSQQSGQDVEKYGGTGLGLSITKKLTELMNGTVEVASTKGQGSTFTITLKQVEAVVKALADGPEYDASNIRFDGATVLIADDIESNRVLLSEILHRVNLNCVIAKNGREALELAAEHKPSIVILDIRMPVMDGYETLDQLQANPDTQSTPVLALTASATTEDAEQGLERGFASFLSKPIKVEHLVSVLARHLPFESVTTEPQKVVQTEDGMPENVVDPDVLIATIENEFLPAFREQRKAMIVEEVGKLADAMRAAGERHGSGLLLAYADDMENGVKLFDIALIENKLESFEEDFSELIKQLGIEDG